MVVQLITFQGLGMYHNMWFPIYLKFIFIHLYIIFKLRLHLLCQRFIKYFPKNVFEFCHCYWDVPLLFRDHLAHITNLISLIFHSGYLSPTISFTSTSSITSVHSMAHIHSIGISHKVFLLWCYHIYYRLLLVWKQTGGDWNHYCYSWCGLYVCIGKKYHSIDK